MSNFPCHILKCGDNSRYRQLWSCRIWDPQTMQMTKKAQLVNLLCCEKISPQNKVGKQRCVLAYLYRVRKYIVGRKTWQWSQKAWLKSRKLANHTIIHTEKAGREPEPDYNISVLTLHPTSYILIPPPKDPVIFPNSATNRELSDQTYETIGDFSYSNHHRDLGRFERKYIKELS